MKKLLLSMSLLVLSLSAYADKSDYIWNIQFEKKMALAEQGKVRAQYDIGNMYLKGQGTDRDATMAVGWFIKAAKQKYSRAEYKLGYLYSRGEGTSKNTSKAFKWITRSAKQNYTPAMFYLGRLYASGTGTDKNLQLAMSWYSKAFAKGYHPAKREMDNLKQLIAKQAASETVIAEPVKKVAVKRVAKKNTVVRKATKKKAAKKKANNKSALSVLSANQWQSLDKPADVFPSSITQCQQSGDKFICQTDEFDVEKPYGTVTYKVKTVLANFNDKGQFNVEIQREITLIFPSDPDDPDVVIPLEYGPQEKEVMRCMLKQGVDLTCYDEATRKKLVYSKL